MAELKMDREQQQQIGNEDIIKSEIPQYGEIMEFLVNGQGTFLFNYKVEEHFEIYVSQQHCPDRESRPAKYIKLEVKRDEARFLMKNVGEEVQLTKKVKAPGQENPGVEYDTKSQKGALTTYWYSYDRDACVVKYGKGYVMGHTTILTHDFLKGQNEQEKEKIRKDLKDFFSPSVRCYVKVFTEVNLTVGVKIDTDKTMGFMQNPLAGGEPPAVKDSDTVSLFDLDRGKFTFSESLPAACRELFFNIRNCELDYPEITKYKLSDAIRYSLTTKGMFLWTIKKSKETEFGDDPNMVYIRVTLGEDVRSGPGIPYVLELWPSHCYSPIHNHGGTCAVIKVLHGQIDVRVHNKETNPPKMPIERDYLFTFTAKKGDITWMDENWYQSHQLKNTTEDYCATIQCYRYSKFNTVHWPGFDYPSSDDNELHTYMPDSDAKFIEMRNKVMLEYEMYMKKQEKK